MLNYLIKPSFYFLHINKTGGSAFSSIFSKNFAPEEICPAGLASQLLTVPSNQLPLYRYYSGHFGLGLPLLLPWVKKLRLHIFTILRHPVDRSLSQLNAYFRNEGTYYHEAVKACDCDVDECLRDESITHALSNYQAKSLAVPLRLSKDSLIGDCKGSFQELLSRESLRFSEDELFALANKSLNKFCFVGLSEMMSESLRKLSDAYGFSSPKVVPKVNVSALNPSTGFANRLSRSQVSGSAIRVLESINKVDLRLYDQVLKSWR